MTQKGSQVWCVFFLSQTAPVMYQSAKELAGCAVLAQAHGVGAVLRPYIVIVLTL